MKNLFQKRPLAFGLLAVFSAYFTSFFIQNTINNALPKIAAELNGVQYYSWAVAIPALASAIVTLIFGKLSDMYGRRLILLAAMASMLAGAVLCATSQTFFWLVCALCILMLGVGATLPLCFSVLGDMFPPAERGKWAGLLNLASGTAALMAPTLGGWLVDNWNWHYIFWLDIPFVLLSGGLIIFALPTLAHRETHRIDFLGSVCMAVASAALILGLSWAGSTYSWLSIQVSGLFMLSLLFWILFLRLESGVAEPIFDPHLLTNRTFLTASLAALFSLFGLTAMWIYYPLFLQGIQQTSATLSGQIVTPFNVLMAFMGIPAGFLLSKTKRYKWMYIVGYSILVLSMWVAVSLKAGSGSVLVALLPALVGFGLGTIPTINALVVQYAVPKRLLGVATGGLYFFVTMGKSLAPAILGSFLNAAYNRELTERLPAAVRSALNPATLASLSNPRVLLSTSALASLQNDFSSLGSQGSLLLEQTLQAVRASLEAGLRGIFLISAATMLISFLLILTIPEIKLDEHS
jgi:MFS family permease